jgi:hypothetical protein
MLPFSYLQHVAMASVYLASKVDEVPMRARDILNVFNHIDQVENGRKVEPLSLASEVCLILWFFDLLSHM